MVIFWNLAGVPFVRDEFAPIHLSLTCSTVIRVLRCLHGLARSFKISFLDTHIRPSLHHSYHSILRVRIHFFWKSFSSPCSHLAFSWDCANSQKSRFKMQTQGITEFRKTFPQLPGCIVKNPTYIQTAHGYASLSLSLYISLSHGLV